MKLTALKISTRLHLGFAVAIALLLAATALTFIELRRSENRLENVVLNFNQKTRLLNEMSESVHVTGRLIRDIILLSEDAAMVQVRKRLDEQRRKYDAMLGQLLASPASQEELTIWAQIHEIQEDARTQNALIVDLALSRQSVEARQMLAEAGEPITQRWQDVMQRYIRMQESRTQQAYQEARAAYGSTITVLLALLAAAITSSAAVAFLTARSVVRPIAGAVEVAQTVASGNLTSKIKADQHDEVGQLMHALGEMNGSLARVVGTARRGVDAIVSASSQLAGANADLSTRTEEQNAALVKTAAVMEQLVSVVHQNGQLVLRAGILATRASEEAEQGREVVDEVVQTVDGIHVTSYRIADIIRIIDDIAFQINILPLNASVEAARAGEQGRGFAVVASEVRALAHRSATAAREIKTLVEDSQGQVEMGKHLAGRAGAAVKAIVSSIHEMSVMMSEIAQAGDVQAEKIGTVSHVIERMSNMTQQNAALVEESAAAAEAMREQAEQLAAVIGAFSLASDRDMQEGTAIDAWSEPGLLANPPAESPQRRIA